MTAGVGSATSHHPWDSTYLLQRLSNHFGHRLPLLIVDPLVLQNLDNDLEARIKRPVEPSILLEKDTRVL